MADELPTVGPPARAHNRWPLSLIWIVPIMSALVGLSLIVRHVRSLGPTIHVTFDTAEGIEVDKTEVKFKAVPIGIVSNVTTSEDLKAVVVTIELKHAARNFARRGTRFWVVKPRVGLAGVSGIGTLISGAYIGADPGNGKEESKLFHGLEAPPGITTGEQGTTYLIRSDDLGSLEVGSGVYFRRMRVGRVVSYELDPDGREITIGIFVAAPNDHLIRRSTRFWNASGIDVSFGADGVKVSTQSLATIAAGGLAFFNPEWTRDAADPAPPRSTFQLFKDEKAAMEKPAGASTPVYMRFPNSMRGLSIGAPLEFFGVEIGTVTSITLDYEARRRRYFVLVSARVYPDRFGPAYRRVAAHVPDTGSGDFGPFIGEMIAQGLRAQARSANLLTGQMYIALDFVPRAVPVKFDAGKEPLEIPTAAGALDHMQDELASIVAKIDTIPFTSIGQRVDQGLAGFDSAVDRLNGDLMPRAERTLDNAQRTLEAASETLGGDSPLRGQLVETLEELQRSARSVRVFSDYLSRHPEALLRGRPADPQQSAAPDRAPTAPGEQAP